MSYLVFPKQAMSSNSRHHSSRVNCNPIDVHLQRVLSIRRYKSSGDRASPSLSINLLTLFNHRLIDNMAIAEVAQQPDIGYTPDHDKYLARVQKRLKGGNLGKALPPGFPAELKSLLVWDNTDIAERFNWTYELTASDQEEIKQALENFKKLNKSLGYVNQKSFPLPTLHNKLREISHEIHHAFGFKVIRGLPVSTHSREEIIIIYAGIASHIAPIRGRQDNQFDGKPADVVLNHIKDLSKTHDASKIGAPAYTTDKQVFHTDSGDVIALLSLEEAEGGESKLSSSWRVYNELARTRPDLIRTLTEPWPAEKSVSQPYPPPSTDAIQLRRQRQTLRLAPTPPPPARNRLIPRAPHHPIRTPHIHRLPRPPTFTRHPSHHRSPSRSARRTALSCREVCSLAQLQEGRCAVRQ
jgi:hypothetical protein